MTIETKCPRCGTVVKAPDSKAGRRGRCPICGGAVRVPNVKASPTPVPEEAPLIAHAGHRVVWVAGAGVLVLLALFAILSLGHHGGTTTSAKSGPKPLTPELQEKLRQALAQFVGVESEIEKYQQNCVLERRLRARNVLAKHNHYEPVADFEDELRRQVLEEQAKAAKPEVESGIPKDEWRLNTPLSPSEKPELDRVSDDLQREAVKLKDDLTVLGIIVALSNDPWGRPLLDADEVAAKVAARKERVRQETLE